MKKSVYIDLIELVMAAYTDEHIKAYTRSVVDNGLEEHGYPRLTANLGILIAHGRMQQYIDEFRKMMDLCCEEIPIALGKKGPNVGNEFSVKEIVFCLLEIEKAKIFEKDVTDGWRKKLSEIDVYKTYDSIAEVPPKPIGNWAAFGAASEQMRKYAGIGDESAFIENQVKSQLFAFDENGMYRDPNEPMVYDFVTRLQLAIVLHFGFDGESREALENQLLKSADITLDMQSVTGEIPFGGRSNQFLHNETFYAALCEYYASVFKKRGQTEKAGEFKNAARLATESVIPWLKEDIIHHVKNHYAIESKFGCEGYAYFDKYMITAASWLYVAYIMADDDIEEVDCPAISKNGICETSCHFHKIMCKYNDYFAQFELAADEHYDANGLGRIHKKGAPSALCLSVPFCKSPTYEIGMENPSGLSICVGVKNSYTYDSKTKYEVIERTVDADFVRIKFKSTLANGSVINETYTISDRGVEIQASGSGEIEILFPMFAFDGENHTETAITENSAVVSYKGFKCTYLTDGIIEDKNLKYANRNGIYTAAAAKGENSITLKIAIK